MIVIASTRKLTPCPSGPFSYIVQPGLVAAFETCDTWKDA